MSKAADKSKSVSAVTFPVSMFSAMSLWTYSRAVPVERNSCKQTEKTLDRWLQFKWTFKGQYTTFLKL